MSPKEGLFWAGFIGTTSAVAFSLQYFFGMNRLLSALCGVLPGFLVGGLLQKFYELQMRKTREATSGPLAKSSARCTSCSWEGDPQMATHCPVCGARLSTNGGDKDNPFSF